MNRLSGAVQWGLALLCAGLGATSVSRADALSAVQVLREGGCGGVLPAARPLLRSALLDQVAQEWAAGSSLPAAAQRSAWRAQATTGVHVSGPDSSLLELLRRSDCRALARPGLRQIGVYRRGLDNWLVLAGGSGLPDTPLAVASTAAAERPIWSPSLPWRSWWSMLAHEHPLAKAGWLRRWVQVRCAGS
jgi:hypothetical protein